MHHKCLKYLEEMFELTGKVDYDNLRLCELGKSSLRGSAKRFLRKRGTWANFGSQYFEGLGFDCVCIDVVGRGCRVIDLSKPITEEDLLNSFDVLVHFGTAEHISDQYVLFNNIHNLCKNDSLIISGVPNMDSYIGHGTWNYNVSFFAKLVAVCRYAIVDIRVMSNRYFNVGRKKGKTINQVYASYIKTEDSSFPDTSSFPLPIYNEIGAGRDVKDYGMLLDG